MHLVDLLVTNRLANREENRMEQLTAREYTSRFKLPQENPTASSALKDFSRSGATAQRKVLSLRRCAVAGNNSLRAAEIY